MFRKTLMLCASLAIVGCGNTQEDEFRDGLPSKEMVTVKEPGTRAGQKLEAEGGAVFAFDKGQTSDFYKLTRGATVSVNLGTAWVLNLIEREEAAKPEGHGGPQRMETRDLVRRLLSRVDVETQAAVIHYHVDGMTLEEVAAALGRSVPTVRKRLESFAELGGEELRVR